MGSIASPSTTVTNPPTPIQTRNAILKVSSPGPWTRPSSTNVSPKLLEPIEIPGFMRSPEIPSSNPDLAPAAIGHLIQDTTKLAPLGNNKRRASVSTIMYDLDDRNRHINHD